MQLLSPNQQRRAEVMARDRGLRCSRGSDKLEAEDRADLDLGGTATILLYCEHDRCAGVSLDLSKDDAERLELDLNAYGADET